MLVSQNIWLTVIGVLIGFPGGMALLHVLITSLVSEYELSMAVGPTTCMVSILLTFGVSIAVSWMVSKKNREIDMVEALNNPKYLGVF